MAEDDGEAEDDTGVTGAQQPAPTAWSIHTALLGFYVSAETQAQHFVIRAVPERRRRWTSGASAALARCVTATCTLVRALPLSATPFYALPSASGLTQVLMHMTVL